MLVTVLLVYGRLWMTYYSLRLSEVGVNDLQGFEICVKKI